LVGYSLFLGAPFGTAFKAVLAIHLETEMIGSPLNPIHNQPDADVDADAVANANANADADVFDTSGAAQPPLGLDVLYVLPIVAVTVGILALLSKVFIIMREKSARHKHAVLLVTAGMIPTIAAMAYITFMWVMLLRVTWRSATEGVGMMGADDHNGYTTGKVLVASWYFAYVLEHEHSSSPHLLVLKPHNAPCSHNIITLHGSLNTRHFLHCP
jgi:hypothetical protein